jgi:hypothetical protein
MLLSLPITYAPLLRAVTAHFLTVDIGRTTHFLRAASTHFLRAVIRENRLYPEAAHFFIRLRVEADHPLVTILTPVGHWIADAFSFLKWLGRPHDFEID